MSPNEAPGKPLVIARPTSYSDCEISVKSPLHLSFLVGCSDCFYGFDDYETIHLGKFLAELGLTADDCRRALEEHGRGADGQPG